MPFGPSAPNATLPRRNTWGRSCPIYFTTGKTTGTNYSPNSTRRRRWGKSMASRRLITTNRESLVLYKWVTTHDRLSLDQIERWDECTQHSLFINGASRGFVLTPVGGMLKPISGVITIIMLTERWWMGKIGLVLCISLMLKAKVIRRRDCNLKA